MRIVLAGSAPAIESVLLPELLEAFPEAQILILADRDGLGLLTRARWVACDILSMESLEAAIVEPIDLAIYFRRTLGPTSFFDQSDPADVDLLLADNFARSVKDVGVKSFVSFKGLPERLQKMAPESHLNTDVENLISSHHLPFGELPVMNFGSEALQVSAALVSQEVAFQESKIGQPFSNRRARSIQRWMQSPPLDARTLTEEYFSWLPRFTFSLVRVDRRGNDFFLKTPLVAITVLCFRLNAGRSDLDLHWLDIRGGLMAANGNRGRLEFRAVSDRKFAVAAIHDYSPALPWFLYRLTQAVVHLIVMKSFASHLRGKGH